jgi:N-acylneuraminate cytidylyltransferase
MNIAVIPARGGSKRIPRKNIKEFNGKPAISYAIKAALESQVFSEVIVSTDDEEIAEYSRSQGAKIPWLRSEQLSNDFATTLQVMQDAVLNLESDNLDNVCCIYPVTPLLRPKYISEGLRVLNNGNWTYVFSAIKNDSNPQRFFTLNSSNSVSMLFPEFELTRTQDLQQTFYDAGQFYWGKKSAWLDKRPIFDSLSTIIEMSKEDAIDIDTFSHWKLAEDLYSARSDSEVVFGIGGDE